MKLLGRRCKGKYSSLLQLLKALSSGSKLLFFSFSTPISILNANHKSGFNTIKWHYNNCRLAQHPEAHPSRSQIRTMWIQGEQ